MTPDHLVVSWRPAAGNPTPKCAPNPAYPDGMHADITRGAPHCGTVPLPYPAPCLGMYVVHCTICDHRLGITAAGRPDDPKTVTFACPLGGIRRA